MSRKEARFACGDLSLTFVDEGDHYAVHLSSGLDELCLITSRLGLRHLAGGAFRVEKSSFERLLGAASPEAFVEELARTCTAWRLAASPLSVGEELRSAGWIVVRAGESLEALKIAHEFSLEAKLLPASATFSDVLVSVRAYPGSVDEALLLRSALLAEGFLVKALVPVTALWEGRLFNCDIPRRLLLLEEKLERAGGRISHVRSEPF